eukprot:TRINITY_DN31954_c0_g1_i2.p1 TRINITY_DN31954_c0_g1~~TRINITY_DN31954_c0_g1_i2.p1  ORF type:complete len:152 (+),score=17.72 TRINITY_DN31954_c0_g1_i2:428-883(+)
MAILSSRTTGVYALCMPMGVAAGGNAALDGALICLAEQTLSVSLMGSAAACVLRKGQLLKRLDAASGETLLVSFTSALQPDDYIALLLDASSTSDDEIVRIATGTPSGAPSERMLMLQCVPVMATSEPLGNVAPHPSWARTVFNEYGTHKQ